MVFLGRILRTYLCSATRVRSYRVTLDRARAIPREMSSTAPLAIVRGTARELFLRHPRGGRLYVVASRLHLTTTTRAATDGPSQDKPWPESAHEYDPSVVLNKTGTSVPSFSSSPDLASGTPRTAHTSRATAPPRPRPPQLTHSHLFFTLHHRLPRHRSGLPQGETRPKRGRGGQVHARHVRGPAVPRRLTPAPQGGRARLRLPPAPRLPSPRSRPLRAVSLFLCTYGQFE